MIDFGIRFMHGRRDGWTVYVGSPDRGQRFVSFHPVLHRGWRSSVTMPGGWEYRQPALLIGRTMTSDNGRWFMAPELLIPAKLYDLWMKRRKAYRVAVTEAAAAPPDPESETP